MALPQWHGFIDPVVRIMADGQTRRNAEIRVAVAKREQLSEGDMAEIMSSGEARWANRINRAVFDSMKAGLLIREARGQDRISDEGHVRAADSARLTHETLMEYEPYRAYQNISRRPKAANTSALPGSSEDARDRKSVV